MASNLEQSNSGQSNSGQSNLDQSSTVYHSIPVADDQSVSVQPAVSQVEVQPNTDQPEPTPWQNLCDDWINEVLDVKLHDLLQATSFEQISHWMANLPGLAGPLIEFFNQEVVPAAEGKSLADIIREVETWIVNHVVHKLEVLGRDITPKAAIDITPWDMLIAGQLMAEVNAFLQFNGVAIPVMVVYGNTATTHNLTMGFVAGLQAFREAFGQNFQLIVAQQEIPLVIHRMTEAVPMLTAEDLPGLPPEVVQNLLQLDARPLTVVLANQSKLLANRDFLDGLATAGMWAGVPDEQIFTNISESGRSMRVAK